MMLGCWLPTRCAVLVKDQEGFDILNQAFNTCSVHLNFTSFFLFHISRMYWAFIDCKMRALIKGNKRWIFRKSIGYFYGKFIISLLEKEKSLFFTSTWYLPVVYLKYISSFNMCRMKHDKIWPAVIFTTMTYVFHRMRLVEPKDDRLNISRFKNFIKHDTLQSRGWSLWPRDAIWRQGSGSTLAQVMAPSHYLNQCWLIISEVQRHLLE